MNNFIEQFDKLMTVLYKYEVHAFVLVASGVTLCLAGIKDVGFSLVTAGTTIFKGKFNG